MRPSVVYFAQTIDGGPVKVGTTCNLATRKVQLSHGLYPGVEIITTIPGSVGREAFIGAALSPWQARGEWFKNCAAVWRIILEIMDKGDLDWVPMEESAPATIRNIADLESRREEFERLCEVGGFERRTPSYRIGKVHHSRAQFFAAVAQGKVPEWLIEAHASHKKARAST